MAWSLINENTPRIAGQQLWVYYRHKGMPVYRAATWLRECWVCRATGMSIEPTHYMYPLPDPVLEVRGTVATPLLDDCQRDFLQWYTHLSDTWVIGPAHQLAELAWNEAWRQRTESLEDAVDGG